MNQEQNNFNFNTQSNNGIPNNQGVNHGLGGNYQTNQRVNHGLGGNYQVNQNNNNFGQQYIQNQNLINNQYQNGENIPKPPKKFNIWFAIILIVIVLAGASIYFLLFNNNESKTKDEQTQNAGTNNESTGNNESASWDDYSLFIDGNEIKLPMKFSDFQAMGFYEMGAYNSSVLNKLCDPNVNCGITYNSNIGRFYGLFSNGTTNNIYLVVYNPFDEIKELKDCYITKIGFEISSETNDGVFFHAKLGEVKIVNNTRKAEAVIGISKYEDVESTFGPHYQYDYNNTLTYYPDLGSDGIINLDDLSFRKTLFMYFDSDTKIFDSYEFYYYDMGDF